MSNNFRNMVAAAIEEDIDIEQCVHNAIRDMVEEAVSEFDYEEAIQMAAPEDFKELVEQFIIEEIEDLIG